MTYLGRTFQPANLQSNGQLRQAVSKKRSASLTASGNGPSAPSGAICFSRFLAHPTPCFRHSFADLYRARYAPKDSNPRTTPAFTEFMRSPSVRGIKATQLPVGAARGHTRNNYLDSIVQSFPIVSRHTISVVMKYSSGPSRTLGSGAIAAGPVSSFGSGIRPNSVSGLAARTGRVVVSTPPALGAAYLFREAA